MPTDSTGREFVLSGAVGAAALAMPCPPPQTGTSAAAAAEPGARSPDLVGRVDEAAAPADRDSESEAQRAPDR